MCADRTLQLSALLACRSLEDLRRLEEVDSPSFPFITLACKHKRADLLKLLFEDDTSEGRRCSAVWQDEGHNAIYYGIRSNNVALLRTLLGSVTTEAERLVSESLEELLLNNVLVSEEMLLFVQYRLLDLRFFSKEEDDEELQANSTANIQERLQLLVENIADINSYTEVDSHFLYTAKFIAQNIHILKQQLKFTYNILPWEQMEFCLVTFVSAHIRRQELNRFYLSVLRRERLLNELGKFASALQELDEPIWSKGVWTLQKPLRSISEEDAVTLSSKYPDLYDDYKEVRDVSSLHMIKTYMDAALLADSATRLGQLTIKRALQVSGEHLKNSLESPKLTLTTSEFLLSSAPKETRDVLCHLRDSLSHPHLESGDSVLYSNIQNDIKKIAPIIMRITTFIKVNKVKCTLTRLINSDSVIAEEFHEVANFCRDVCTGEAQEIDTVTKESLKLIDLISNIKAETLYENNLIAKIKDTLDQSKLQNQLTKEDYTLLKQLAPLSFAFYGHSKSHGIIISSIKRTARTAFQKKLSFKKGTELERSTSLAGLLSKLYDSVSSRIEPEIAFELKLAMFRILLTGSFDKGDVKFIDIFKRQLDETKKNRKEKEKNIENSKGKIGEDHLTLKIRELRDIIGTDRVCGQLHEHLSSIYKDMSINRFVVEALVLDIMTLLESTKRVSNNMLYLDWNMPLLGGKCLRNHLAHGNALVDILPTDACSAVLLNAVKLTESEELFLNRKMGNVLKHNISQLKHKYKRGLSLLDKQKEMWKSLLDGNFEKFKSGIAGGADIWSRTRDLSSALHHAARGPSIETIKFLTEQKMSTEVSDVYGQTALHIAATCGRDDIVKFLVAEMGNAVNQLDDFGKTPLHLATQNGHKKTVMTLFSLEAEKTIKDMNGYSPLHYAAMGNSLDLVKIFLKKGVAVGEKTDSLGFTCLHIAAEFGHVDIVQYLLLKKAVVNAKSTQGILPLHQAAINGHQEVVNILLDKGAYVDLEDSNGYSPLHYAVIMNHERIVKILLEKDAVVNNRDVNTPLHKAASNGNTIIVSLLLEHKANINARENYGSTPLHCAAEGGHADIVAVLLDNKDAKIDSKDDFGRTALHVAAWCGHTSVVQTLIQRGIDIHTQNIYQATPLFLAVHAGHQQVVNILLDAGASVNSVDESGFIALYHSALNGNEAILEAMIKNGADVKYKNSNLTPLHVAAMNPCNEKTIRFLLDYVDDVNQKEDRQGYTALHFASFIGGSQTVKALLKGETDVNAVDIHGHTALHVAVSMNHKAVVETLLDHEADVNYLSSAGFSVLCYAAMMDNKVLLDMLIAKGADVNVGGGRPLLSAITSGHTRVIEALLKNRDVDINIKNAHGSNLLYTAAVSGNQLIAKELINRGINIGDCIQNPSPLSIAISFGHTEFVEVLLEKGANVNTVEPNLSWDYTFTANANKNIRPHQLELNAQISFDDKRDNCTPLHIAANAGNLEVIKLLVDRGANINATNKLGWKPIHTAARGGNLNILVFFLDWGMSIDDRGSAGWTLMHCAADGGRLEVAKFLMGKHVNINSRNKIGSMPIHYSAEQGHTEMVKFLLHSGTMFDATNDHGRTPSDLTECQDIKEVLKSIGELFKAVKKNDVETVRILVEDLDHYLDVRSSDNATLLHIASRDGCQGACDILLKVKANPNSLGKRGNAPLHYASKHSHPGIVKSLLKNGATYNLKTDKEKTPLNFATKKDIKSLLQMVELCFGKVQAHDVEVIKDITKKNDVDIIKAVMKARDTDGYTLVVVAMKCGFPHIDQLKQVSQANTPDPAFLKSLLMQEKFTEILEIYERQLSERIEIFGEDNPGTLDVQYNIAYELSRQCKYPKALHMLKEIYRKRVEVFGHEHPDSLKTKSMVASLHLRHGRYKESQDMLQEVMPMQQRALGEAHENLLETKFYLGATLNALGKQEEALCLYTEIDDILKNKYVAHHPNILHVQEGIAAVLKAQGKHQQAKHMYKTIYKDRKRIFGLNHSETLRARQNLANVIFSQNTV